jgi:hypothetical protein
MEENTKVPGGAESVASGTEDSKVAETITDTQASGGEEGKYPAHFVDKLKKEKAHVKAQLDELRSKLESSEKAELEKQAKFRELWEAEQNKRQEAETQLAQLRETITQGRVVGAVKRELDKLGLRPEAGDAVMKLVDTKGVMLDEDTNTVLGAEDAAKTFFESYKTLGFFGGAGKPTGDHRAPLSTPQSKTLDQMSVKEKLNYLAQMKGK